MKVTCIHMELRKTPCPSIYFSTYKRGAINLCMLTYCYRADMAQTCHLVFPFITFRSREICQAADYSEFAAISTHNS
jgi:hypothetical protein